jgi:hypothetical protein
MMFCIPGQASTSFTIDDSFFADADIIGCYALVDSYFDTIKQNTVKTGSTLCELDFSKDYSVENKSIIEDEIIKYLSVSQLANMENFKVIVEHCAKKIDRINECQAQFSTISNDIGKHGIAYGFSLKTMEIVSEVVDQNLISKNDETIVNAKKLYSENKQEFNAINKDISNFKKKCIDKRTALDVNINSAEIELKVGPEDTSKKKIKTDRI